MATEIELAVPRPTREDMIASLRGLWRLITRYEKVFHSAQMPHEKAELWRAAVAATAAEIRAASDERIDQVNAYAGGLKDIVREKMGLPKDDICIFLDCILWR